MNFFGVDIPKSQEVSLLQEFNPQRPLRIAFYSRMLYEKVKKEMQKTEVLDLFNTLEMPLANTLAKMEIEGFPLDSKTLDSFGDEYRAKMAEYEELIYKLAGYKFNLNSPN